MLLLFWRII